MAATTHFNPFPGLRPFRTDEDYLFFGREGQSEEILHQLRLNRFVSVVGTSGSGKSSLVRAGLLPYLFGGFMAGAGSHWRVAVFRPGSDPIGNLANALNEPTMIGNAEAEEAAAKKNALLIEVTLRRGGLGLIEAVRLASLPERDNLLIVVDQFEELFRFANAAGAARKEEDAAAFVKLLLEAGRQSELPLYVVITMRSDFIGDCARFRDLPEAVTAGLYLIPRMTREQRRAAIEGPVQVGGAAISRRLVNRLLNEGGDDPDLLPSLQHALMRTWAYWEEHSQSDHPIDIDDYDAVGGISEALSRHAEEAYAELPDERHRGIAKRLFQSLTEKGADNREVRRPTKVADIAAMAGAEVSQVISVIEYFRREGRSFLMPPPDVPLDGESVIDISHESLIRGWGRLKTWVEQETDSARMYRRLAETAALHGQHKAALWNDPDLSNGLAWREKEKPTAAWAKCYHPAFEQAMAFLEESQKSRDEATAEKERRRREELRRVRLFAAAITGLFLIAAGFAVWAFREKNDAQAAKLAADTQRAAAVQAEGKANRAARKATEAEKLAEGEKRRAEDARQAAESALVTVQKERKRADTNKTMALDYAGETLRGWQSLPGAITDLHEAQDFYEKLLTSGENVPRRIMESSPDDRGAMVFWVIDAVGIPNVHYNQGRTKQAQEECGKHEQTAEQWAQDRNPFKRVLAADLLSDTAKTRLKLGDQQAALSDARHATTIADMLVAEARQKDDRSWNDLGIAYDNAGEVEKYYEHWPEALHDYLGAASARAKIAETSMDWRHSRLQSMMNIAEMQIQLKRKEDALATYREAVAYAEATVATASADDTAAHSIREQALLDAAAVYAERGQAERAWQQDADAERDFNSARSKAAAVGSQSEDVEFQLSIADERLGNLWKARAESEKAADKKAEDLKRAEGFHTPALEERKAVVKIRNDAETEFNLGIAEGNLARDYAALDDLAHSIEHYRASVAAYLLSASLHGNDDSWVRIADASDVLAQLDAIAADKQNELKDYQGAVDAGRKITKPTAESQAMLFSDLAKIADLEESIEAYDKGIEYGEDLTRRAGTPELIDKLFWLYVGRGDLRRQDKQYPGAEKDYEAARSQAARLDANTAEGQFDRAAADDCFGNLLLARSASEKGDEARKRLLEQAIEAHQRASDQFRRGGNNHALAIEENTLARDYGSLPDLEKARQHYQLSINAYKEAAQADVSDEAKIRVADSYQALASFEEEAQNYAAARAAIDNRIALLKPLATKEASKSLLARTFGSRSWLDLFVGDFEGAIQDANQGLGYDSTQTWILTNKAHGYLFSGKIDDASDIYLVNASKPAYPDEAHSQTFGAAVLEDFDKFRKHPNPAMNLAAITQIEQHLKNVMSAAVQAPAAPQNSVGRP